MMNTDLGPGPSVDAPNPHPPYTDVPCIPDSFPVLIPDPISPIPKGQVLLPNLTQDVLQAPAQRLPHELLAKIFLEVAKDSHSHTWGYSWQPHVPILFLLGHVCSKWRYVAHGTPKLWTSFSLQIRGPEGTVDYASIAKAWLARAHPYPLHVSLDTDTITLRRIMYAIVPSAPRLQTIQLCLPLTHPGPLVEFPAVSMPLLESVWLLVGNPLNYQKNSARRVDRTTAFATAPSLKSISLSSPGVLFPKIQLPWWQCTGVHISLYGKCPVDICRNALIQCANLVECTLSMDVTAWENPQPIPDAVLPLLQKLDVFFEGIGFISAFFRHLTLPALKDLTVHAKYDCGWDPVTFVGFMLRSSLYLESLRILGGFILANHWLDVLPQMGSLVTLQITSSVSLDDSLLDAFCYRGVDSQPLVPQLNTLLFAKIWKYVDDNKIADMIESRWWIDDAPRTVSRLKKVVVGVHNRKVDAKVKERLDGCRREGLDLRYLELSDFRWRKT